jgi:hypothetical protein
MVKMIQRRSVKVLSTGWATRLLAENRKFNKSLVYGLLGLKAPFTTLRIRERGVCFFFPSLFLGGKSILSIPSE